MSENTTSMTGPGEKIRHAIGIEWRDAEYLVSLRGYAPPAVFTTYLGIMRELGGRWNGVRGTGSAYSLNVLQVGKLRIAADREKIPVVYLSDMTRERVEGQKEIERAAIMASAERISQIGTRLPERERRLSGRTLYDFQREGVKFLTARRAALLCDEPGLGKTAQTLMSVPEGSPLLIVGPAVAKSVWSEEIEIWRRGEFRVSVLEGMRSFRAPMPGEAVITNYDILETDLVPSFAEGTVLVADEAHLVKSRETLRTERFTKIAEKVMEKGGTCWLLTATPLLNEPYELYNQLRIVGLDKIVFGNFRGFFEAFQGRKEEVYVKGGKGKKKEVTVLGSPVASVPERLRQVMLRRRKKDVAKEIPAKRYEIVSCDLESDGVAAASELDEALKSAGVDVGEVLLAAADLKRAGSKIPFQLFSKTRARLASAKIPAMIRTIEEHEKLGEPLVVFSSHVAPVKVAGSRPGWAKITGATSKEERTRIKHAFQAGELRGVAGTIKACGVAITLTRSARVLFVDREYTPAWNEQAEDRVHRLGQRREVIIRWLVGRHRLEERIAQVLMQKEVLIASTLND